MVFKKYSHCIFVLNSSEQCEKQALVKKFTTKSRKELKTISYTTFHISS